ncbi:MAG: hypothetical protein Q8S41_12350 [Lutibacter sp.]|nr:hypothetical protein [Lutibacter sp.]
MELSFPLLAGIIAAILHVISGPDHLAAVTPFAIESKKKAWKVGLFWGIGHLLGMISIGILFLMFKDLIPIEKISMHSEKMVGIILIGLALWIFFKIFKVNLKHNWHNKIFIHVRICDFGIACISFVLFFHQQIHIGHYFIFFIILVIKTDI